MTSCQPWSDKTWLSSAVPNRVVKPTGQGSPQSMRVGTHRHSPTPCSRTFLRVGEANKSRSRSAAERDNGPAWSSVIRASPGIFFGPPWSRPLSSPNLAPDRPRQAIQHWPRNGTAVGACSLSPIAQRLSPRVGAINGAFVNGGLPSRSLGTSLCAVLASLARVVYQHPLPASLQLSEAPTWQPCRATSGKKTKMLALRLLSSRTATPSLISCQLVLAPPGLH